MIGFQLGREYKLSVAEILSVFPEGKIEYLGTDFLILSNLKQDLVLNKANRLGGTIKIVKIEEGKLDNEWISNITNIGLEYEGKFKYGLSIFGDKQNIKSILMTQKKELKSKNISSRFINKDFKNLSSAQIIGERLIEKNTEFNYIYTNTNVYFGIGIWVQDINSYSTRDYSKDRDMMTGMLPPKLCQMMINIAGGKTIYDPFVGLGTVLIESIVMGNKEVYGSDHNEKMVEYTTKNITSYINSHLINKGIQLNVEHQIDKLNSKYICESDILLNKKIDSIVTEGYLGEMMTKKNISIERIGKQKITLIDLYSKFFEGLQKIKYKGNIVISFPYWEMKGKYIYFTEIYELISMYCNIEPILPENIDLLPTQTGSLLYKRDKQGVGREIFKLKIKA